MTWVDLVSTYLYLLKYITTVLAILLLVFGIDDLFIDIVYWGRRIWRKFKVYSIHKHTTSDDLFGPNEAPLAIMVPAWQEANVIRRMADHTVESFDYENYHIFIGTYPNDPETQAEVDAVCARYSHVHKVICSNPGPTNKADNLNHILMAIMAFEQKAKIEFAGFVMHDAEDVVPSMELRIFNFLLPKKDLIQLPVYPLVRPWFNMTAGHYADEFSETHGKDVVVREALTGQVPSAGVGTCFSRKGMLFLLREGDGMPFDTRSLTEDYDIGIRLKQHGMSEVFVRMPLQEQILSSVNDQGKGHSKKSASVVSIREHFPDKLSAAIRQKTRWIVGIIYQGSTTHKWSKDGWMNYFLWRDRRGGIGAILSFLALFVFMNLVIIYIYQLLAPDAYRFLSVFDDSRLIKFLLIANGFIFINRLLHRIYFVGSYYGILQAILSIPRLIWGIVINFAANIQAIKTVMAHEDRGTIAWDKTTHEFPELDQRAHIPVGKILLSNKLINENQLNDALTKRQGSEKIGQYLLREKIINSHDLASALAEQSSMESITLDPFEISESVIKTIPEEIALKYAILPVNDRRKIITVARETALPKISQKAIERRIKRKIQCVIAPQGTVTMGLRYWYSDMSKINPRIKLDELQKSGEITQLQNKEVWNKYTSQQIMLGDLLQQLNILEPAVASQALLNSQSSDLPLGEYLVENKYITQEQLEQALSMQSQLQPTLQEILESFDYKDVKNTGVDN